MVSASATSRAGACGSSLVNSVSKPRARETFGGAARRPPLRMPKPFTRRAIKAAFTCVLAIAAKPSQSFVSEDLPITGLFGVTSTMGGAAGGLIILIVTPGCRSGLPRLEHSAAFISSS